MVESCAAPQPDQSHLSGVGDFWDDRETNEGMLNMHGEEGELFSKLDVMHIALRLAGLHLNANSSVLEVGGGNGRVSVELANRFKHLDMIE